MSDAGEPQQEQRWREQIRWRVRETARARGVQTALQLSARSGVNKNSMTSLWNGTALRIDRDSLAKLCHALHCTPGELLVFVRGPGDTE
jgi:DNA-binding Xre family transcriptional regulator